jgi:hypothetical protein
VLSAVTADYACADEPGGSGVASCTGSIASADRLATGVAAIGAHTFSVTAIDKAGNKTTVTHHYRVSLLPSPPLATCPGRGLDVVLLDLRRDGSKVKASGLADRALHGQVAQILANGVAVAHAVIRADGSFAADAPAPRTAAGRIRYAVQAGSLRSATVKLTRHMTLTGASHGAGRAVLTGRLRGSGHRRPRVYLLARTTGCHLRFVVVGHARLHRDGTFRVAGKPLGGARTAIYRARSTLAHGRPTYTLSRVVTVPR